MQLAFALFGQTPNIDSQELARNLQVRWPAHAFAAEPDHDAIRSINVDGAFVLISIVPMPYPPEDFAHLHPFSKRGWRETQDRPEDNRAHTTLVVYGAADEKASAQILTLVVAELCRRSDCLGVLWSSSAVLAHSAIIEQLVVGQAADTPALALWIAAQPYRGESGLGATTHGLTDFIGRELHLLPHASHADLGLLFQRTMDFAEYLYQNGPVVADGQSIGYSETDVLRASWTEEPSAAGNEPARWLELRVEPGQL